MDAIDSPGEPEPLPVPDATKHTMVYVIVPPATAPSGAKPTFVLKDSGGNEYTLEADATKHTMVLKI